MTTKTIKQYKFRYLTLTRYWQSKRYQTIKVQASSSALAEFVAQDSLRESGLEVYNIEEIAI